MNQRSIIEGYALSHGHTIVGESFDDNVSGMRFDRKGLNQVTRRLNAMERKTTKQLRDERQGKAGGKVYRWTYQSVKNVLSDESSTGVLINHQTETHNRTVTDVPKAEQYRHEKYYPVIIQPEEWQQVQALLKAEDRGRFCVFAHQDGEPSPVLCYPRHPSTFCFIKTSS